MQIDISDQRKGDQLTRLLIDQDAVEAYCGMAGVDLGAEGVLKIRFRNGSGPYGFTSKTKDGFRVVINVRYKKLHLSDAASYVLSNTLLHEIAHVAQGQQHGWAALDPNYHGWSEVQAREVGRQIKESGPFAVR